MSNVTASLAFCIALLPASDQHGWVQPDSSVMAGFRVAEAAPPSWTVNAYGWVDSGCLLTRKIRHGLQYWLLSRVGVP